MEKLYHKKVFIIGVMRNFKILNRGRDLSKFGNHCCTLHLALNGKEVI